MMFRKMDAWPPTPAASLFFKEIVRRVVKKLADPVCRAAGSPPVSSRPTREQRRKKEKNTSATRGGCVSGGARRRGTGRVSPEGAKATLLLAAWAHHGGRGGERERESRLPACRRRRLSRGRTA